MDHLAHFNKLQRDLEDIITRISSLNGRKNDLQLKIDTNKSHGDSVSQEITSMRTIYLATIPGRVKKAAEAAEVPPDLQAAFNDTVSTLLHREVDRVTITKRFSKNEHDNIVILSQQELGDVNEEIKKLEYGKIRIERRITKCKSEMASYLQKLEDKSCQ